MPKKLTNPTPVRLPSGSWRCQVMVQGRRISVVDDDPEVAHTKALAIKNGILQEHKSPASMTVGEMIDRYIESKDSVLSPATIAGYKRIRKNALQDLMPVVLAALTQERVQRSVNAMAREKSPKSVRNAHGLLSAALEMYYPQFALRTTLPQKQPHEINIPDVGEIKSILAAAQGTKMELPILLAVWLGLRASEIRGLTWRDIDGDVLHVRQAIVEGEDGPVLKKQKPFPATGISASPSMSRPCWTPSRRRMSTLSTCPARRCISASPGFARRPACRTTASTTCAILQPQSPWQSACPIPTLRSVWGTKQTTCSRPLICTLCGRSAPSMMR